MFSEIMKKLIKLCQQPNELLRTILYVLYLIKVFLSFFK